MDCPTSLSAARITDRLFIAETLKLLFYLNVVDHRLDVVMMVYYIEGGTELREMILEYWSKRGLDDPLRYFNKAMEALSSFEQRQAPTGKGRREVQRPPLIQLCQEWMAEWAERYLVAKAPQLLKSSSPTKLVQL